jgi:hypothetical protein
MLRLGERRRLHVFWYQQAAFVSWWICIFPRTGSRGVCPLPVHFLSEYWSFGCTKVRLSGRLNTIPTIETCTVKPAFARKAKMLPESLLSVANKDCSILQLRFDSKSHQLKQSFSIHQALRDSLPYGQESDHHWLLTTLGFIHIL